MDSARPLRVFLSRTSELGRQAAGGSFVDAARSAITAAGHVVVDMADFPAEARPPAEVCRHRVQGADVYIGVVGFRWGSAVPNDPHGGRQRSYVEFEYDEAVAAVKPRLVFILAEDAEGRREMSDREHGDRQEQFRTRLLRERDITRKTVRTPDNLELAVFHALTELTSRIASTPPGSPAHEWTDPFALEVHRAIDGEASEDPTLPRYVPRDHDTHLGRVVAGAAGGRSSIVVLVGGSSTGKTRACWEALQLLPAGWRLWHPVSPSWPEALLAGVDAVAPSTVLWLNDLQHYLMTDPPTMGEKVAAKLRELLRDADRGPVLILGTMWPEFWASLTAPASAAVLEPDNQTRQLLAGADLVVPEHFSRTDRERALREAWRDSRLRDALEHASDGEVVQYLAGGPALAQRYRTAPAGAKALIEAAMDVRRLGHPPEIGGDLLRSAARGYLTERRVGAASRGLVRAGRGLLRCAVPGRVRPGRTAAVVDVPADLLAGRLPRPLGASGPCRDGSADSDLGRGRAIWPRVRLGPGGEGGGSPAPIPPRCDALPACRRGR